MKYAVAVSLFTEGKLTKEDIYMIKAEDPTVLKDALFKIISAKNGINYKSMTSAHMGLLWDHNNNRNSLYKGAFKIFQYLKDNEKYWVCFYKKIKESETITIKEDESNE